MSLSKLSFPKLKELGESVVEEVKDSAEQLEETTQQIKTNIEKGVEEVEEKMQNISKENPFTTPISEFFSKNPTKSLQADSAKSDDEEFDDEEFDDEALDDEALDDAVQDEEEQFDKQSEDEEEPDDEEHDDTVQDDTVQDDTVQDDEKGVEKSMNTVIEKTLGINADSTEEDTDSDDEDYHQKFDEDVKKDYLLDFHPEAQSHNYEEVKIFATVKRNKRGDIIDPLHRTIPILTKYERTRVLGQRAKQLNSGAPSTVKIPDSTIDGYLMALEELRQRMIPFIIRRPIPNGGFEYWKISDLELLE